MGNCTGKILHCGVFWDVLVVCEVLTGYKDEVVRSIRNGFCKQ